MITNTGLLINAIKQWFQSHNLNTAVIGFSGGIDSATTAALLHRAGIKVILVQACMPNQKLSSSFSMMDFAGIQNQDSDHFMNWLYLELPEISSYFSNAGKEAALPILRNAYFYGVVAEYRKMGQHPIVVGTANFDEAAYLGFWGKASDGAQDMYPISHLHKSEVYELAKELNVPQEIIDATPSGDLLWSGDLNDYKMIGATYDQIEDVANIATAEIPYRVLYNYMLFNIDNPLLFAQNIIRNNHKYINPFPGVHIDDKLERFRVECYPAIYRTATRIVGENKHA